MSPFGKNRVLITGHTGFKGTWLTLLLESLGADVYGISLPPVSASLYDRLNRRGQIDEAFIEIRNEKKFFKIVERESPGVIIHLAAEAIVNDSYSRPVKTFETNIMGTANMLNAAFAHGSAQVITVITTDKVYRNTNEQKKFVENDPLEGKDPYSASKVGTEAVVSAWRQIAAIKGGPKVCSARAGNVLGGGDLANDRILPDLIRSSLDKVPALIRNPRSTRPWQHVLDPLNGYIKLTSGLMNGELDIPSLNFGPDGNALSVQELVEISRSENSEIPEPQISRAESNNKEARYLELDSRMARELLAWRPFWTQEEAIRSTVKWWRKATNTKNALEACKDDLGVVLNDLTL